ncbi:unnamed protein product [Parnassius mnemosyne]|uniref:Uncharacterized protein n=1 Tax=Parnassius mnemosyne TaxID=213953 RepID=A0AAV1KDK1_9NEOP
MLFVAFLVAGVHELEQPFNVKCMLARLLSNVINKKHIFVYIIYKLVMPVTRLHGISNSFMGQCIRFYNKIPEHVQSLSINKFKSFIKEKLYKKGYYNIKEYMNENNPWE